MQRTFVNARAGLALGGMVPFSPGDFPGRLAAVLFAQGCPLRCRYCHNPHLRPSIAANVLSWDAVTAWLMRRRGLLDAVVISGGEPTLQSGLGAALTEIRDLGFATGLHSAGVNPKRLASVLPLLDWVGLDIKAPFDRYDAITGSATSGRHARDALSAVVASGKPYEIRTTIHAHMLGPGDLQTMAGELQRSGVREWVLQLFRPTGCAEAGLQADSYPHWLASLLPALRPLVPVIAIR